jgi:hypothetical protein
MSCCPPYAEDINVTSTNAMTIYEYPRIMGGVVEVLFMEKEYILTTEEFDGVKKVLGDNYMNATLDEFKQAYMVETI